MSLYAGITSSSFKYSYFPSYSGIGIVNSKSSLILGLINIKIVIVTMLKQGSQSAGNFVLLLCKSTSETLRDNSNIKKISVHVPTHLKPLTDSDFGFYLAGLIEGDGHFILFFSKKKEKTPQIVIVFNSLDASLAYYIKGKLGFGNVYKIKQKKAVILVISKLSGIEKVLNLISGKIRSQSKIDQINNNIITHPFFGSFQPFSSSSVDLNNHWLTGFADADASFQIKIITRNNRTEVRLNFQIDQKKNDQLILIKNYLGGNIGYRKSQDTYYYSSTSFGSANNTVKHFDRFHLLSSKHINYLKWRKAYILIQNREHLNTGGIDKILKLKNSMNRSALFNK